MKLSYAIGAKIRRRKSFAILKFRGLSGAKNSRIILWKFIYKLQCIYKCIYQRWAFGEVYKIE